MSASESTPTDAVVLTGNIDAREVVHYESLSDTWWDQQVPFWTLHKLNAFRSTYLRDVIARTFDRDPGDSTPLGNITVLDAGCGSGILGESMAIEGVEVHGIDVTVLSWLVAIVGAEHVLGCIPKGTHRWQQFVSPQVLKEIFSVNAFETVRKTGVRMNPVNRCFMLTRSLAVNYMVVARRPG